MSSSSCLLTHKAIRCALPDLLHQVLVQLVLVDVAQLLTQQLRLLLDQREYEDLFVLVQETVLVLVEQVYEV